MSPPYLVCPIGGAARPLGNILRMPRLEAGALALHAIRFTFLRLAGGAGALLTKADDPLFAVVARLHDVRLLGVVRRAARLVASHTVFVDAVSHFFRAARKLSTILG